jgi:catalase
MPLLNQTLAALQMTFPPIHAPNKKPRRCAGLRRALGVPGDAPFAGPLLLIAGVGLALTGAYGYAAGWLSPSRLSPTQVTTAFNRNFGAHPGFRRNHAKGICVIGHFDGNGKAEPFSEATVFGARSTPVIGRFAIPGGNPEIADANSPVRSMALLFQLPNGEQWRTGMNNTPMFAVKDPQGFYQQLLASRPDPATGKPDPARMKAFFDAHPETAAFRRWVAAHPPSSSLANGAYYSINAFKLIGAGGAERYVRWAMVPENAYAPVAAPPPKDPGFLEQDLVQRLQQGPLRWHLMLTLAQPGDATDDATQSWPADRTVIDAGALTLERAVTQDDGPCRDVNFDPLVLPRGIAPSNDPLLAARSGAYSKSFNLRTREEADGAGAAIAALHPTTRKE